MAEVPHHCIGRQGPWEEEDCCEEGVEGEPFDVYIQLQPGVARPVDVQAAAAKGSESAATVACAAGGRPERTGLQGILQLLQPPSWADEVAAPPTTGLTARGGGAWATLPGGAAAWRVGVQAAEAGPR